MPLVTGNRLLAADYGVGYRVSAMFEPIAVLSLDRPALRPLVLETSLRSLAYAFFRCILKGRFEHRMRSSV